MSYKAHWPFSFAIVDAKGAASWRNYKIVSNENFTDTEEQVNELLQDGWTLHGDLKVADSAYVQAMVKWGDYEGGNDVSVYLQESFEDAIRSIGEKIEDSLETGLANLATAVGHRD